MNTRINYLRLAERFWELHDRFSFESNDVMAYFFLLNASNKLQKKIFTIWDKDLKAVCGVSMSVLMKSLRFIQETGLIQFENVDKDVTKFTIIQN